MYIKRVTIGYVVVRPVHTGPEETSPLFKWLEDKIRSSGSR